MNKVFTFIGGVLLVLALIAAAGLSVWAYQLNSNLASTRKQLTTLQGGYDKLKADNAQLKANLDQSSSTLDQTKSTLATTQASLTKASADQAALQSKIDKVRKMLAVANALYVTDENDAGIEAKVKATGDSQFLGLWNTLVANGFNNKDGVKFVNYLFGAMEEQLK